MKNKMCSYSDIHGMHRGEACYDLDNDVKSAKSKRVRCPECGRSIMSAIRTCHDGCCIYHCIPPHKIKGWWKKPKKKSRDTRMRRR